jgi:hypothetical protein
VEQGDEPAANEWIVAEVVIGPDIGLPQRHDARRFRPKSQKIVIIVCEDNSAARSNGTDHRGDNRQRIGYVLEQVARVRNIERAPFVFP